MEFAYPLNWETSQNINNLIECNILAIQGKLESPFWFTDENKCVLTDDTMPNLDTIIKINQNGFMTLDSQPSGCSTYDGAKKPDPEYCCGFVKKHNNPNLKNNDEYECIEYQRAYCGGFIHKFIFDKFVKNIRNNYNIYYYNLYTDECVDDFVNLTYVEYDDMIHYATNFDDSKGFYVDYYLPLLKKYISEDLYKKFQEEMIYIEVIDLDYNTGKNIYQDILNALE
jgi:hypothetical protein